MYVLVESWQDAIDAWRARSTKENETPCDDDNPDGVMLLVTNDNEDFLGCIVLTKTLASIQEKDQADAAG